MPLETVTVAVQSDEVTPQPVDGIIVRVFETDGTLVTEGTTGAVTPGEVEFSLDGDDPSVAYDLRFGAVGSAVQSPQRIEVFSPPASSPTGTNSFSAEAALLAEPQAPNARMCRVSGYIWDPNGKPRAGHTVHFIYCHTPLVVDGVGVLGERVVVHTNSEGYLEVDLVRNGMYIATVEAFEDAPRDICVPDRGSVNLTKLLFPRVETVNFTDAGPWTIAEGDSLEISTEVLTSASQVLLGTGESDIHYSVEDQAVATVSIGTDTITLHGVAPGSTQLVLERREDTIKYIPNEAIYGGNLTINVV